MSITVWTGVLLLLLATPAGAAGTAWLPVELSRGHIVFPVTIEGKPGRALLDSGSNVNVISRPIVEELRIPVHRSRALSVEGVHVRRSLDGASKVRVGMFGAEIVVNDLVVAPCGYDLILGLGFFKMFIIQIDYPQQRMRLVTRDSLNLRKLSNVPIRRDDSGLLQVKVDLNGEKVIWALLDTGNSRALQLPRGLVHRMGWLDRFATEGRATSVGIHGVSSKYDTLILPNLTIGPFTLSEVPVSVMAKNRRSTLAASSPFGSAARRASREAGLLGYDILRHFVVTVDALGRGLHFALPEDPSDARAKSDSQEDSP